MSNFRPYQNLDFAFAKLFEALAGSWSKTDIAFVNELVAHAEYGEALENLVALGQQKGKGFNPAQAGMVAELAAKMGISVKLDAAGSRAA